MAINDQQRHVDNQQPPTLVINTAAGSVGVQGTLIFPCINFIYIKLQVHGNATRNTSSLHAFFGRHHLRLTPTTPASCFLATTTPSLLETQDGGALFLLGSPPSLEHEQEGLCCPPPI